MLPISIFYYLVFGGGSLLYFILVLFFFNKLKLNKNFISQNKFILKRFRTKFFYWEAIVTLRKTILSLLNIFLNPMLVVVTAIGVIFLGIVLHERAVPFKRKFHNL